MTTPEPISMSTAAPEPPAPGKEEPPEMPSAGLQVELGALAVTLLEGAGADARGRAAHILLKEPILRTTMIALLAGRSLAEHNTPPAATLQCLQGHAVLKALDDEWSLTAGSLVSIPPERHSVDAVTDCVLLLTVAFPA